MQGQRCILCGTTDDERCARTSTCVLCGNGHTCDDKSDESDLSSDEDEYVRDAVGRIVVEDGVERGGEWVRERRDEMDLRR